MDEIGCTIPMLPDGELIAAAATAVNENPANAPAVAALAGVPGLESLAALVEDPMRIAMMTQKYWGKGGVRLTVGWMDDPPQPLRAKILSHMNAWGKHCNVAFAETNTDPQVRVARGQGGYWSYLGTDILHVPRNQPTMNLEGFTANTPDAEFARVVRHEAGHTLGFVHEHMRADLIARLDVEKTFAYFQRTQGWSRKDVIQQVLTPLEARSIMGTEFADEASIMCYSLPASITIDNRKIVGGGDINGNDGAASNKLYPKAVAPPPPDEGDTDNVPASIAIFNANERVLSKYPLGRRIYPPLQG